MSSDRSLEPEWLDVLPADDPRAMRSRRDLRRVNALMLQSRIMTGLLHRHRGNAPQQIVELGGGDGMFMLSVARRLAWRGVEFTLVDRQSIVGEATRAGFAALGWRLTVVQADVFAFLEGRSGEPDIATANLFLHHFSDKDLGALFGVLAKWTPFFVACEPRRSSWALFGSRMLFALGCNDVSRHDAVASVRAGFSGDDLSRLWPGGDGWRLDEREAWPFTHSFVAAVCR
jgi:hypothetical protein